VKNRKVRKKGSLCLWETLTNGSFFFQSNFETIEEKGKRGERGRGKRLNPPVAGKKKGGEKSPKKRTKGGVKGRKLLGRRPNGECEEKSGREGNRGEPTAKCNRLKKKRSKVTSPIVQTKERSKAQSDSQGT